MSCSLVAKALSQPQNYYPPTWETNLIDSLHASIQNFCNHGHLAKAFKAFSLLQLHGDSLNRISISSILQACSNLKSLPQGKQIHAHLISSGSDQNPVFITKLVTFYSTCGNLRDAHVITENSQYRHAVPWNVLISAYVRNGLCPEALSAYKQMVKMGVKADNFTYPSVLKACGEEFDLGLGREVHVSIDTSGLDWNLFVQNALVSMYAKCGLIQVARQLFDEMPKRDVISGNVMIGGYAQEGMWEEAFGLFEQMKIDGLEANIVTWNTIAGGNLQIGNNFGALKLISQMKTSGTSWDHVTLIIGLAACSRTGMIKLGKEIHGKSIRNLCDGTENVKNSLITMYSRCKYLNYAYFLFQIIENKSLITWNAMISGCTHLGRSEETAFVFRDMVFSNVKPNYVTLASILPLCARVANLQHGKELHCYLIKNRFENYLLLWNSLVDMYSKSGRILEAHRVFNLMPEKDQVSYTALIAGYGMQGKGQAALKLFEEMNNNKIKPDHIIMVAVLSACSHSGLVARGQTLFEKMVGCYGLIPKMEHFSCMVDLFGRAGLLKKAEEVITKMPFRPSAAMWATLIGSCRIHGNTEIGEWAAENLLEMKPENPGYYVLIANMYAAAGCWDKLAKVRTVMRDMGLKKSPGCTWIEVNNGFHPFLVGDRSHPQSKEIYMLLDGLAMQMQEAGYVANRDFALEYDDV